MKKDKAKFKEKLKKELARIKKDRKENNLIVCNNEKELRQALCD